MLGDLGSSGALLGWHSHVTCGKPFPQHGRPSELRMQEGILSPALYIEVTVNYKKIGVQNTAAPIIARQGKYDHISAVLCDLHWLPIDQQIEFKVLVLVLKALHGLAPPYLQ